LEKCEAVCSFEILVPTYQTTELHGLRQEFFQGGGGSRQKTCLQTCLIQLRIFLMSDLNTFVFQIEKYFLIKFLVLIFGTFFPFSFNFFQKSKGAEACFPFPQPTGAYAARCR
jgi:hypothetical protein